MTTICRRMAARPDGADAGHERRDARIRSSTRSRARSKTASPSRLTARTTRSSRSRPARSSSSASSTRPATKRCGSTSRARSSQVVAIDGFALDTYPGTPPIDRVGNRHHSAGRTRRVRRDRHRQRPCQLPHALLQHRAERRRGSLSSGSRIWWRRSIARTAATSRRGR